MADKQLAHGLTPGHNLTGISQTELLMYCLRL